MECHRRLFLVFYRPHCLYGYFRIDPDHRQQQGERDRHKKNPRCVCLEHFETHN